ncbi:energy-coupling factor transport system permease protein [Ruminiclostridium sufflavum DSM 19573]|uniref:Energy-coupling factor transport system permease protein n=1 Tax=Ruminiclostridium sufflavum DSM 19573 TaxID=1121337 RepID=A0A318XLY9_9FIRM|nr:energy-coupling factor transporter transmembrane component T [Ruminiclostridium sufflavum]PYG87646.1 energy-coupling factor transport system permease protein [Ruminiclostridium sufflavum DSM 19573]
MKGILEYSQGDTVIHRLNPLTKMLIALLLCMSSFLSNNLLAAAAIIALNVIIGHLAGIGKKALSIMATLLKLGAVLFLIQVLLIRTGDKVLDLPLNLYITNTGLKFSLLLVLRLVGATMPLVIMLTVTKMSDLTNVLVQKLHIPYKYAFAFITALRFIPIFEHEMNGIIEAQTARGVEFDTKNPVKKLKLVLPLCVPLLISSVKRIEGSAISAELRGFNVRKKNSGYKKYSFSLLDYSAVLVTVLVLIFSASIV